MNLALLTCTGDRPRCLDHLAGLVARRAASMEGSANLLWVVVDDGAVAYKPQQPANVAMTYIRRERQPGDPAHTLPLNIAAATSAVGDRPVVFIEDDDYYKHGWLDECVASLERGVDVHGEGNARYYHVGVPGWREIGNRNHASLAATSLSNRAWCALAAHAPSHPNPSLDSWLWTTLRREGMQAELRLGGLRRVWQFKGMPGRKSTLVVHKNKWLYSVDAKLAKLKSMVDSEDFKFYSNIVEGR